MSDQFPTPPPYRPQTQQPHYQPPQTPPPQYQDPSGPPTAPVPPVGGWTVPAPEPTGFIQPGTPEPGGPARRSRVWVVVAVIVALALVIGGAAGAFVMLTGFGRLDVSIDTCEIAADGALTATGTVDGPSGTAARVIVDFVDTRSGEVVDSDSTTLDLGTAPGADPWRLDGQAGDDVDQVTCEVTAGT